MEVFNVTAARARLKQILDRVVSDHQPVIIARAKGEAIVLVSLSDWNAIEATRHLLSNRSNADRLAEAVRQLGAGEGRERRLIEG